MNYIKLLTALTAFWTCVQTVLEAEKDEQTTITFSITAWDDEIELMNPNEGEDEDIVVPRRSRSLPLTYSGPLNFTLKKRLPSRDGVEAFSQLAEVSLPPNTSRALILLIPNTDEETKALPYRTMVIDDNYDDFPPKSMKLLNFTDHELIGQLGQSQFQLGTKAETVVSTEAAPPPALVPFRLMRSLNNGKDWKSVKSTAFSLSPDMRLLALVLKMPSNPNGVRMVLLRDRVDLDELATGR